MFLDAGVTVIVGTHSPVLAAFPGAEILEFNEEGIARRSWAELDLVTHRRTFMAEPSAYLRHLFSDS